MSANKISRRDSRFLMGTGAAVAATAFNTSCSKPEAPHQNQPRLKRKALNPWPTASIE